jgi:hypothetical protein
MFIALGYDARTIADILGHSSPDFTLRQYAHSFEEVRQRAVADVGKLLRDEGRVLELPALPEAAPFFARDRHQFAARHPIGRGYGRLHTNHSGPST